MSHDDPVTFLSDLDDVQLYRLNKLATPKEMFLAYFEGRRHKLKFDSEQHKMFIDPIVSEEVCFCGHLLGVGSCSVCNPALCKKRRKSRKKNKQG